MTDARRLGRSKLVYNKATRTIDTVRQDTPMAGHAAALAEALREIINDADRNAVWGAPGLVIENARAALAAYDSGRL